VTKHFLAGSILVCGLAAVLSRQAEAAPVVYTLITVSDGKLGETSFKEAEVTLEFHGDTRNVVRDSSSAGVFANHKGYATVTVTINHRRHVARFESGEVFVRYDTKNGLVGFGSVVSPTYPVTLGCGNADCTLGDDNSSNGIAQALALYAADPSMYASVLSGPTKKLRTGLTETTLLTGGTHACPVPYTTDFNGAPLDCSPMAPIPVLHTDRGDFSLQDKVSSPSAYSGNTAVFTVVTTGNEHED
jgi:hypothetical protein